MDPVRRSYAGAWASFEISMNIGEIFKGPIYNVSNFLSLARAGILLPFLYLSKQYLSRPSLESFAPLLGLILLAVITDYLDGFFARRLHQETALGVYLDPICDKILAIGVLLIMIRDYSFPLWLFSLFMLREVLVIAGGIFLFVKRNKRVHPNMWGKWGVGILALCVFWYVCLPLLRGFYPSGHFLLHPEPAAFLLLFVLIGGAVTLIRKYWRDIFLPPRSP